MAAAAAPPAARSHNWSNLVVTFSYPSCSNASQQAQTKAEGNSATSPTDEMFRDALDLHKFVRNALPDRALEIADTIIWLHGQTQDNIATSRIQECLVSVFVLGISCSKQQPQERPSIRDAAIEMHAIRDVYLEFVG